MIKQIRVKILLIVSLILFAAPRAMAESSDSSDSFLSRLQVGVATGYHANMMRFHGISKAAYPSRDAKHSGLFLLSAEYSFNNNFSVRPELGFLSRGGKLHITNVGRIYDGLYSVKASYFDIRIPVIYNFNLSKTKFKPYAYIAPLVGFPMGGNVSLHEKTQAGEVNDYKLKLSKANHAAAYFAVVAGAGVKYPVNILNHTCHIGLEFSYEYGITDTYSKMERNNQTVNINHIYGPTASTRKNSGFELKVAFQVPISIFGAKVTKKLRNTGVVRNEPIPTTEGYYKTDCYTLQEIQQLIASGQSVVGKTICAIDAINFDTAKSIIKEESKGYLNQLADVLIETGLRVEIKGHTDSVGTDESNMQLSKDRAISVQTYLVQQGVDPKKITYSYYGESRPMDTNNTPEGRLRNRRVEFELLKK